jgi:plastocyanin
VDLVTEEGDGEHPDFPSEDGEEVPAEFYFDPVGVQAEPDTVVQFLVSSGEHTATAFHEKFHAGPEALPTRVPEDVLGFTSPPILPDESWLYQFPTKGVYDVLCLPHLGRGMVMRIVVMDPEEDDIEEEAFTEPTAGPIPPNAEAVLTAEELDPARIVDAGPIAWEDLTIE